MNILILNQDWFAEDFRREGHEVTTCGLGTHLDVTLHVPLIHLDSIIEGHLGGKAPDRILILDNSAPLIVEGLAETSIPLLFYSVDVHHHAELHDSLCHVVDHVFMAQRDYCTEINRKSPVPVEWLPLWASRYVEPSSHLEHGCVFVGTLNRELNEERVDFFEALQKEVPVLCMTGKYWEIFPHSRIVINQTVKGDLNFRVFEAMMSGSMLLTEMSGNGLTALFEDGKHLVTYEKGNVQDAAQKIRMYLEQPELARSIAAAGRKEILEKHTTAKRAQKVLEVLLTLQRSTSNQRYFSWMKNFTALSNRLKKIDTELSRKALLAAMRASEMALDRSEQMTEQTAFSFVYACCKYDMSFGSEGGNKLLQQAADVYPEYNLFKLALVRGYLNSGNISAARALAKQIGTEDESFIFSGAEKVITELLNEGSDLVPLNSSSQV